ncbi:uncharacterized protein BX664DRAFT_335996 [Halteromyces radiatus]|uniref:uncharacterized protein n=1 Tax=Halteromyces radiatus TaxID=101107 RepID=UPI00221FD850|nr:uncharacterized protein BX664DRAFT_335996 [Halteromyces radiatus]KAI8086511.1 hypothetical protein BX664DRAFT_335996 [Halteromyces radiatus]
MSVDRSSYPNTFSFQPPVNLEAIRFTIRKRIHHKRQHTPTPQVSSPTSSISSSSSSSPRMSVALLDHGLPSPPVEYQLKQTEKSDDMELDDQQQDDDDCVSTISSLPPSNSSTPTALDASSPSSLSTLTSEQVELKIKQLKEEKHRLFTQMKNLLKQEEKPVLKPLQTHKPSDTLKIAQKQQEEYQETSLPSPSPSPTTTPKTMKISNKQQPYLKSSKHPTLQHLYRNLPRRRSSYHTTSSAPTTPTTPCLPSGMIPRYYHSSSSSSNNMMPPSSLTMDNGGRYRYSPYGGYFTPVSSSSTATSTMSPPSGYSVRRSSHFSSRLPATTSSTTLSTSSLSPLSPLSPSSSSSSSLPSSFRPSRPLVARHTSRY